MSKIKLLLDVVEDMRSLADSLQSLADAMTQGDAPETEPVQKTASPPPKEPAVTLEQVRAVLAEKSHDGKTEAVRELLQKYGAPKLSAVDPTLGLPLSLEGVGAVLGLEKQKLKEGKDLVRYSLNGGTSWTQFSTTAGTSASITLSSLSPNTTYSVRVQARKQSNQVYGSSGTVSAKTLGGAVLLSCGSFSADASTISLSLRVTVYNAAYTNYITIKNGSTTCLSLAGRVWSAGTAYRTITLTSSEQTTLLNAMASVKSFTATIELVTKSGSTQIGNASTCTCTVSTSASSSGPTLSGFTFADSYSTTTAITGNDQVLIQDYSRLTVTPGTATARNGASIVSYSAVCSGVTKSNTTGAALSLGTIGISGTRDITLTVTDSRGYTASVTQSVTVVPYSKPKVSSVSLRRTNDIETEMQLVFSGSISPVTVDGAQKNSLLYVRYRYKLTSASSYNSYTSILGSVSATGSSFSYSNLELCNLNAESSYDFHLQIRDQLNSLTSLDLYFVVSQGTPLVALRKKMVDRHICPFLDFLGQILAYNLSIKKLPQF